MQLSSSQLDALEALPLEDCAQCDFPCRTNYCRDCDEFFDWGHDRRCSRRSPHEEHRTY